MTPVYLGEGCHASHQPSDERHGQYPHTMYANFSRKKIQQQTPGVNQIRIRFMERLLGQFINNIS